MEKPPSLSGSETGWLSLPRDYTEAGLGVCPSGGSGHCVSLSYSLPSSREGSEPRSELKCQLGQAAKQTVGKGTTSL